MTVSENPKTYPEVDCRDSSRPRAGSAFRVRPVGQKFSKNRRTNSQEWSKLDPGAVAVPDTSVSLENPVLFFSLAYVVQGISQHFGLISQPLQYFLMNNQKLSAGGVAFWMSLLMVPWIIKPVYALFSDFMPISGYRRRSYLLLASTVAGLALLSAPLLSGLPLIMAAFVLSGVGMAFSNVVLNALTVERSKQDNNSQSRLWSTQGLSYYGANIACVALGGFLCERFGSSEAIEYAAVVAGLLPLLFLYVVLYAVRETKCMVKVTKWKAVWNDLKSCFRSPAYLAVGLYMCLFNFCPAFNVPLYFYESNALNFNQFLIGQLNACNAFGMLCGALVFKALFERKLPVKWQLMVTAILSAGANLTYLMLGRDAVAASVIHFVSGIATMSAILAMYEAATKACPRRMEATAFATLIALYNLAGQLGQVTGGHLFTALGSQLTPLIWISALTTLACAPLSLVICKNEPN